VTGLLWLSDYEPSLRDGPGDSRVFVLDSGKPGATMLVVAGTHANEIAGMTAATVLVERAVPAEGRLIVVPKLNSSGLSYVDGANPRPSWIRVEAVSGTRYLKYGARLVHPAHQGRPDPERYAHPGSRESLPGEEQRNINRAYPGYEDGPLAQRVALAVMRILERERVDVAVDMHEARPSSKLKWIIVANPKNLDIAVNVVFDLEDKGIDLKLDRSSDEFRGLSHREWGDGSAAAAFLVETPNPAQESDPGLVVDQLRDPLFPLWKRVGAHLEALSSIAANYSASSGAKAVRFEGAPDYETLERLGLESFL